MNIYDTAHKLAEEIKRSDECVQLAELRERAYADETNRLLLEEYKRLQVQLQMSMVGAAGEIIRRELADAGFAGRLILRGDHEIALRGAITGAGGILIAGTGSICCGVDENGRFARVGGWGHLIDDGGSGYAIGRDALALTVRGEDGRAPRGALHDTVLRRTGAADARGIVEFTYHGASKAEVAALAAEVLRLAVQGDAQSAAILRREAEELRELVSALARELAIAQPRIALMGGLLAEENVYREAVCAALSGMAQPVRPLHDALWGAAQLAFEALGE